eukprot:TRINITY_DN16715_c0_g1_i3.p1 TRINITY_DN16715_c0_g1~~TRINITY_DN16715_c0_g1_i3.p1  ORF type:complete len:557 (+),score=69.51 TRINITY_DN16715_c0_g1_i3:559-2229(+)
MPVVSLRDGFLLPLLLPGTGLVSSAHPHPSDDSCCIQTSWKDKLGITSANCDHVRRKAGCFNLPVDDSKSSSQSSGGWSLDTTHAFQLLFTTEGLKLLIDGAKRVDVTAAEMDKYCDATYGSQARQCKGAWRGGRIAWYNFSQQNVKYSDVRLFPLVRDGSGKIVTAPVAQGEAYAVKRNGSSFLPLTVSATEGLLINDYSPELDTVQLVVATTYNGSLSKVLGGGQQAALILQHGSELRLKADGSFVYTPSSALGGDASPQVEFARYAVRTGKGQSPEVTAAFVFEPSTPRQRFELTYAALAEVPWASLQKGAAIGTVQATGDCVLVQDWQLDGGAGRFRLESWIDENATEIPGKGVKVVANDVSRIRQEGKTRTTYTVTVTAFPVFGDPVREQVTIDIPAACEGSSRCECGPLGTCECRANFGGASCAECADHFVSAVQDRNCTKCATGWGPDGDCRFNTSSEQVESPAYKAAAADTGNGLAPEDSDSDCSIMSVNGTCVGWLVILLILCCVLFCCAVVYVVKTQGTRVGGRGKKMRNCDGDEAAMAAGYDDSL